MSEGYQCALYDQKSLDSISASALQRAATMAYSSIMAFKALGLPDRYIDCIDPVTDACDHSANDQEHAISCSCLKESPDDHDIATPFDTSFPTESIGA